MAKAGRRITLHLVLNLVIISIFATLVAHRAIASPLLSDIALPVNPQVSDFLKVTIKSTNASQVTLFYRVMFGVEQVVTMVDDGTGQDEMAGDHIYSASIPPQVDGTLIRVRFESLDSEGITKLPSEDDTMPTRGFVVGASNSGDLPVFRWYIEPSVFEDLITNHLQDDAYVPTVVALGNQVFDNAKVRVKGESSVHYPKRKYKFKLPKGYNIGPPYFERPVDEFALNVYFLNFTDLQEKLAWKSYVKFGFRDLPSFYVQVNKNTENEPSQFYGHYLLTSDYSKDWQIQNDYNTGALYKEASDKKTRKDEDFSDINSLKYNLENLEGEELKNYLLDNLNIPNIINYNAISAVILSQDWTYYHNIYQYRDTEGTKRWEYVPWDLDNALAFTIFKDSPIANMNLDPINIADSSGQGSFKNDRIVERALFQFPEFRQMYYRRLATVYDQLIKSGELSSWYQELYDSSKNIINEDINKWSSQKLDLYTNVFPDGLPFHFYDDFPLPINVDDIFSTIATASQNDQIYRYGLQKYINTMETRRLHGEFPDSQPNTAKIQVTKVVPASAVGPSYIELYNSNDYAVDISNWSLSGDLQFLFDNGSVISAKSSAVIASNDALFRDSYAGSQLVLGQYGTQELGPNSTLVLKDANGVVSKEDDSSNKVELNLPSIYSNNNENNKDITKIKANSNIIESLLEKKDDQTTAENHISTVCDNKQNCQDITDKTVNKSKNVHIDFKTQVFYMACGITIIGIILKLIFIK
jgi:hypothetical protein